MIKNCLMRNKNHLFEFVNKRNKNRRLITQSHQAGYLLIVINILNMMVTLLFYALLASLCVKSALAAFGQAQELDYLGEKKLFWADQKNDNQPF